MPKPQTQWFSPNRNGNVIIIANLLIQDNLGHLLVDNHQSDVVTTTLQYVSEPSTLWSDGPAFEAIEDEMNSIILDEMGQDIQDDEIPPAQKPDTQWFNPNRHGNVQVIANLQFVDNLGHSIVDNLQDDLVTTTLQSNKQPATAWSQV